MTTIRQWGKVAQGIVLVLGLVVLYVIIQWLATSFKDPNQMGIVESMVMDMEIQVPQGAAPVSLETVSPQPFVHAVTYTGTVEAYADVSVFPRIEGWITQFPVYAGDRVTKGQLLAQLDTAEQSSKVQKAQAQHRSARQSIGAAKADLDYWEKEFRRAKTLAQEEVITPEEFEREQAQYETAKARYETLHADLAAASSSATTESIQLGYTRIVSPVDGVVTDRLLDPGVLVNPGMPLLKVADISPVRIQVQVAEKDFVRVRPGNRVHIQQGSTEAPMTAQVTSVFPDKDPITHTGIVEALVPNDDARLLPGDFVTVTVELGEKQDVLTVPNTALIDKDQQQAVWQVKNGKATLRYVTTGVSNGTRTEVVDGLAPGDQIITAGYRSLVNGAEVVEGQYGPNGLTALPKVARGNRLTAQNHYRIQRSLEHMTLTARLLDPPPQSGHHHLLIELTPLHGTLPDNLQVEAKTLMPAMPKMSVPKPTVQPEGNHRYRISTHFSMPGLWQVIVVIGKNQTPMGRTTIEVEVTE